MKLFFTLIFLLGIQTIQSQTPTIQWQKCLGGSLADEAYSIVATKDGGYAVAGYSESSNGNLTSNKGGSDVWVAKLKNNGILDWQKNYGGTGGESAETIIQTLDGGYLVAGYSTSSDGDLTGNKGIFDYWVFKISETGTLEWQKNYGGPNIEIVNDIKQTKDSGYIIIGTSGSSGGDLGIAKGGDDIFVIKTNKSGAIQWKKNYGGTLNDGGEHIIQTYDGGYAIAGYSLSTNGDATINKGNMDAWIIKTTNTGTITWQKSFGGTLRDLATHIKQTADSGYIVSGEASSNNGDITTNKGSSDCWLFKLNKTGTLQWQKTYGTSQADGFSELVIDNDRGYIISGFIAGNDGDITQSKGSYDAWIVKTNTFGQIDWQKNFGGTSVEKAYGISLTQDSGIIVTGSTASNNGNVSGNHGSNDVWVFKLSFKNNKIYGKTFNDYNGNGIKDGNDNWSNFWVKSNKINPQVSTYSRTNNNGNFENIVDSGNYTTSVLLPYNKPYYNFVPTNKLTHFDSSGGTDYVDFAVQTIPNKIDMAIYIYGSSFARRGFDFINTIKYLNEGTSNVPIAQVTWIKDVNYNLSNVFPIQDSIKGDTLYWNLKNIKPDSSNTIKIIGNIKLSAPLASTFKSYASIISSAAELTPQDNSATMLKTIRSSFDPNDKQENHNTSISKTYINDGEYLQYLVRFQNTGNDTAFIVKIVDDLDSNTIAESVDVIATSHNYELNRNYKNKLTFLFKNILLPDSTTDKIASMGYIIFKVKVKTAINVGDSISNRPLRQLN